MRKKLILFFMLLAAVGLWGCGAKEETETEAGITAEQEDETSEEPVTPKDDDVRWQDFVADMGMGWNLGNTFDSIDCDWVSNELDYEAAWVPGGPKTTKEMIQLVKDQGFRTIRIPVSWHNHVDITTDENGKKCYTINEQWMKRVKEVVDYCYDEGLYVVINIHHDDEDKNFIYPTEEYKEQSIDYITQIWTQVATEFADYDLHLLYEVYNEVRLAGTDDEWTPDAPAAVEAQKIMNEYTQAGVDTIRSVGGGYNESRFIMCTGYAGNLYSYKNQVLPTDKGGYPNRIMVSTHPYVPSSFCMDASENGKSVFDEQVQVSVKEVFRVIDKEWTSKDVPVVISEWGTVLKPDNEEERIKHAAYYVKQAMTACKDSAGETVQIPCILWDNGTLGDLTKGETFGFLDRQNLRWFDQGYVDAIIEAAGGVPIKRSDANDKDGQLINGDFAEGINGFEVYSFVPEDISYNANAEDGFSIDISDTGEEDWHIQLKQGGIRLQKGKWYEITLDAKSSLNRSILCSMQRDGTNDNNWTSYSGAKNLALSKQWKTYKITFQMTENTDERAIFNLTMGTVDGRRIKTKHTVGIRNIKLKQLADNWMDQLAEGDNLLKNADFAYAGILWEPVVIAPGAADTSFANGEAAFHISNTGEEDWHIQLKQGGVKLQQDKWYQITLDARSSMDRSILCSMQRDGTDDGNWTSYSGSRNMKLTNQWKTYKVIFQMTENTDERAIFNLAMGAVDGNKIKSKHTVGIKNVKLEELADNWMDQLNQGGNLLKNADFGYEDILWEPSVVAPGEAKTSFADGKAVFDISNVGTIDWHVQLKQSGITLEQGSGYRLTFKASSSVPRQISVGFMDKDYVNWYGGEMVKLTPEEQTVTIEFYMDKATDTDVRMFLSMGKIENENTPASVITLSDFSLVKANVAKTMGHWGGGGGGGWSEPIVHFSDGFTLSYWFGKVGQCREANGEYQIEILDTGTEGWHVQLQKTGMRLEKGRQYRMSFDAKSTVARDIYCAMQRDGTADQNWTEYSGNGGSCQLGSDWKTFNIDFTMTEETDSNALYNISLGDVNGRITTPHTVSFRNLKLEDMANVPIESVPVNTEMLQAGKWTYNLGSGSNTITEKDGTFTAVINDVGEVDHYVQIIQDNLTLESGCTYEFTCKASFAAPQSKTRANSATRKIRVGLMDPNNNYDYYGGGDMVIGGTEQECKVTIDVPENKPTIRSGRLAISMGKTEEGTSKGTVTVEAVSLKKTKNPEKLIADVDGNMLTGMDLNVTSPAEATQNGTEFAVGNLGNEDYHIQLKHKGGLKLEGGAAYEFTADASFAAKEGETNDERAISVSFMNSNYSSWYGGGKPEITGSDGKVHVSFTMENDTDENAVFTIDMGKIDNSTPLGTISLSNLCLKKTADAPKLIADTEGNMLSLTSCNKIISTDNRAEAACYADMAKFKITKLGNADWNISLEQGNLNLEGGHTYRFTGKIACDVRRTVYAAIDSGSKDVAGVKAYTPYTGELISVTDSASEISGEFTVSAANSSARFVVSMGKFTQDGAVNPEGEHTVTLSDFALVDVTGTQAAQASLFTAGSDNLLSTCDSTVNNSVTVEEDTDKADEADKTDKADKTAEGAEGGEDKKEDKHTPNSDALVPEANVETKDETDKKDVTGLNETSQESDKPKSGNTGKNETEVEQTE